MNAISSTASCIKLNASAASDKGLMREHNEDSFLLDEKLKLFIVADGMGGHEHGKTASKMACDLVLQQVNEGQDVESAIVFAHRQIQLLSKRICSERGMGTTIVVAQILGPKLLGIWWVGDSRVYASTKERLRLLTHDHSRVQELVDLKIISQEQALRHPQRNIITRSLGMQILDDVKVDACNVNLTSDMQILLCSDGLSNELNDNEIHYILKQNISNNEKANRLISAANSSGGRDNITAAVLTPT